MFLQNDLLVYTLGVRREIYLNKLEGQFFSKKKTFWGG